MSCHLASESQDLTHQRDETVKSHDEKQEGKHIASNSDVCFNYLTGSRLHAISAGLGLGLFLVNFEVTVMGTALVLISNDLQDFARGSWVVTAYLLTYTGASSSKDLELHLESDHSRVFSDLGDAKRSLRP
ncbi:hypothetical protein QQS21_010589 [Conoideocrella luteorostrata]|uniref:Uncharacterized protein n=1 Tax=Conoideocrella luteorostrata TaxID=1105319 RepID=A0AAJ0FU20_9HYPO|nr:hypothetical protein QQS21_010589 [Conoideocrella luteorostrata]